MEIKIRDVTQNNFNDIPSPSPRVSCKSRDYWEGGSSLLGPDSLVKEENKKSRIIRGAIHAKLLYVDGKAVGYCQYGKLSSFPRSLARRKQFKAPTSENVFFITCVSIRREFRGRGFGTSLLASVVSELRSKGVGVIEACVQKPYSERFSSGPEGLYEKCGFTLVEELPNLSLMRTLYF